MIDAAYPGISLIFPVYNEEKVIETTLEHYACFREKFNLEIIVADDLSRDRTLAGIERPY
ncbi:MAG: glycosyltransferase [Planctomycetes bacterium]|nr:glycosyltransferase [Planctomycetota bacterium]